MQSKRLHLNSAESGYVQPPRCDTNLKKEDRRRICEGFQQIERDLAFGVLEAWHDRKLDEFVATLENLRIVREITVTCAPNMALVPQAP